MAVANTAVAGVLKKYLKCEKSSCKIKNFRYITFYYGGRGIAQPGRALALGARCRRFESRCPDHWFFLRSRSSAG